MSRTTLPSLLIAGVALSSCSASSSGGGQGPETDGGFDATFSDGGADGGAPSLASCLGGVVTGSPPVACTQLVQCLESKCQSDIVSAFGSGYASGVITGPCAGFATCATGSSCTTAAGVSCIGQATSACQGQVQAIVACAATSCLTQFDACETGLLEGLYDGGTTTMPEAGADATADAADASDASDATIGPTGDSSADAPADVQGDGNPCASCAGTCALGRCVVTVSDNQVAVTSLAVDSTSVYWTASNGSSGGHVVKASVSGGSEVTLAAASEPISLAVDSANVYFTDLSGGTILSVPLAGTTVSTLVGPVVGSRPSNVVLDSANVYWTDFLSNTTSTNTVMSVPKTGGGGTAATVASGLVKTNGMARASATLYFSALDLLGVPTTGGTPTTILSANGMSYQPSAVVVDSTNAYFIGSDGGVWQASLTGLPTATPLELAVATSANCLTVDATNVYYVDIVSSTEADVMRVPISGGSTTTLAVDTNGTFQAFGYCGIAVDSASVYFVPFSNAGTPVMKATPK